MTTDPLAKRIFFEVHADLPRQGPGNFAATAQAFLATGLTGTLNVLDLGCGPGQQTIDLAKLAPLATIHAVDLNAQWLTETERRAGLIGAQQRVSTSCQHIAKLDLGGATFDLIWSEGAAYIMGLAKALTAWKPLLKPNGYLAFTECVWLTQHPPAPIFDWWSDAYPAMASIDTVRSLCAQSGYEVLTTSVLPKEAWWDDYYRPMSQRLDSLERKYANNPTTIELLQQHRQEISNYQEYSEHYGYAFFVLRLR